MPCESKFWGAIGCWWWAGQPGNLLSYSGPGHWAGRLQERVHPSPPAACWPRDRRPVQGTLLDGSGQGQRAAGKGPVPPHTPGRSRGEDLRTALGPARPAPPQSPGSGYCCSACGLLAFHPHPWIPTSWFLLLTTARKDAPPLPGLCFPESRVSRPRPRRGNTTDFLVWVPNARTGYEAQI